MTSIPVNTEFLLAEDAAIKDAVSGLTVPADREAAGNIDVGVWFRWPQREYGDALFPFITIDLVGVQFDAERAHSYNYDDMHYLPDTSPVAATPVNYRTPYPVPVKLLYLVATHTRSARHDRILLSTLLGSRLPLRFGGLYVPQDGTIRRLDVLDIGESNDYDSLKKRVFRRMFTIGVSAEMLPEEVDATVAHRVDEVIIDTKIPAANGWGFAEQITVS